MICNSQDFAPVLPVVPVLLTILLNTADFCLRDFRGEEQPLKRGQPLQRFQVDNLSIGEVEPLKRDQPLQWFQVDDLCIGEAELLKRDSPFSGSRLTTCVLERPSC